MQIPSTVQKLFSSQDFCDHHCLPWPLRPWTPQHCPLTVWIFAASFIEMEHWRSQVGGGAGTPQGRTQNFGGLNLGR